MLSGKGPDKIFYILGISILCLKRFGHKIAVIYLASCKGCDKIYDILGIRTENHVWIFIALVQISRSQEKKCRLFLRQRHDIENIYVHKMII